MLRIRNIFCAVLGAGLFVASAAWAGDGFPQGASQTASPAPAVTRVIAGTTVYIEKMDGFENYLAAAFAKKKVQLVLVTDRDKADYIVSGTSEDKKAGWAKIVFLGDIHSDADASVTLTDKKSSAILFAYSVNKKNTLHGAQTTAEACAKHLHAQMEEKK